MDEEREYQEYNERYMSRGRIIFRRCVRYAWRTLIVGIIALVFWRVLFSDRVPKDMKTLTANDTLYEVYQEQGEKMEIYTQNFDPVSMDKSVGGYFWICQAVYIPEAKQLQVLVRYNNSTLGHIAEARGLDEEPSRDEKVIDVTLAIVDQAADTDKSRQELVSARVQPTAEPTSDETLLYNYRRYIFDNVTFDPETTLHLAVDIYYIGNVDYDDNPYTALVIWEPDAEILPVELTRRDKGALDAFGEEK